MKEGFDDFIKDEDGVMPIHEDNVRPIRSDEKTITITARELNATAIEVCEEMHKDIDDSFMVLVGTMIQAMFTSRLLTKLFGEDFEI